MLLCIDDVGKHYPSQASVIKTGLNHAEDGDRKIATIERKDKTIKTPSRDEVIRPKTFEPSSSSEAHDGAATQEPQWREGQTDLQRSQRAKRERGSQNLCTHAKDVHCVNLWLCTAPRLWC